MKEKGRQKRISTLKTKALQRILIAYPLIYSLCSFLLCLLLISKLLFQICEMLQRISGVETAPTLIQLIGMYEEIFMPFSVKGNSFTGWHSHQLTYAASNCFFVNYPSMQLT